MVASPARGRLNRENVFVYGTGWFYRFAAVWARTLGRIPQTSVVEMGGGAKRSRPSRGAHSSLRWAISCSLSLVPCRDRRGAKQSRESLRGKRA